MVAEEIWDDDTVEYFTIAETISFRISMGEASASDLESMGITDIESFGLDDELVEEATRILKDGWQLVRQEVEYLLIEAETAIE
ncbi:hypothetical protein [Pandoraea pnomenusa]|uniref:hypothetical protein n=1 Tax=Pandoraea pnomenusa TaxID=93220 RepID=UPI00333FA091